MKTLTHPAEIEKTDRAAYPERLAAYYSNLRLEYAAWLRDSGKDETNELPDAPSLKVTQAPVAPVARPPNRSELNPTRAT